MAKRFTNIPKNIPSEVMLGYSLDGTRITRHPDPDQNIAIRTALIKGYQPRRVAVVSGCGSGHDPLPMDFIGEGMLTAAVAGELFKSPTVPEIKTMLEFTAKHATGILAICMNYSCHSSSQCDKRNFETAIENFKSNHPRYPIEHLSVQDDCVSCENFEARGLAGIAFVLKIAGSAADSGWHLDYVFKLASLAADSMASFSMALDPSPIPGHADEHRHPDEIDFGIGIHGERQMNMRSRNSIERPNFTDDHVATVCEKIDNAIAQKIALVENCNALAIMVNNLGGVARTEMKIIEKAVSDYLSRRSGSVMNDKLPIYMYSASYVTSLAMNGISITCLLLTRGSSIEKFLNTATPLPSWTPCFQIGNSFDYFFPEALSFQTPNIDRNASTSRSVAGTPTPIDLPKSVADDAQTQLDSIISFRN